MKFVHRVFPPLSREFDLHQAVPAAGGVLCCFESSIDDHSHRLVEALVRLDVIVAISDWIYPDESFYREMMDASDWVEAGWYRPGRVLRDAGLAAQTIRFNTRERVTAIGLGDGATAVATLLRYGCIDACIVDRSSELIRELSGERFDEVLVLPKHEAAPTDRRVRSVDVVDTVISALHLQREG